MPVGFQDSSKILKDRNLNYATRPFKGLSSKNSSKPPSSDYKKNKPKSANRGGALPGHKAHQRKAFATVDRTEQCTLNSCPSCGGTAIVQIETLKPFQWVEWHQGRKEVVNYVRARYRCTHCATRVTAPMPDQVSRSPFGPQLQSMVALCRGGYYLSQRSAADLLQTLTGIHFSCGTVAKIETRIADALEPAYDEIHAVARNSDQCKYVDETSWRTQNKTQYVWTIATDICTVFRILPGRSRADRDQILGKDFRKPIVTDRYSGYSNLETIHQYCLAHVQRNCQRFADHTGWTGVTGRGLVFELEQIFRIHKEYRQGHITSKKWRQHSYYRRRKFEDWLRDGYVSSDKKLSRFCSSLLKDFDCLWTYLRLPGVELTNNQAERALRSMVIWRKRSFGSQSETGARYAERIMTLVQTTKQLGKDVLEFMRSTLLSRWNGWSTPMVFG